MTQEQLDLLSQLNTWDLLNYIREDREIVIFGDVMTREDIGGYLEVEFTDEKWETFQFLCFNKLSNECHTEACLWVVKDMLDDKFDEEE
jgi:hypothetical protein